MSVLLTAEQAQQIEEALEDIVRVFEFETGTPVEALATIRAARAQAQEPVAIDWEPLQNFWRNNSSVDWEPLQNFWRNNSSVDWEELEFAVKCAVAAPVRTKDLTEQQALEKLCNYINQNFKTQKEAAKSFEVTEGFLSMVLNGKKPITEAMAHRLSLTRQTMFLELTSLANGNTAPVRTKDLTDDELFYAIGLNKTIHTMMKATEIGRAAIAADRKLNGVEK